MLVRVVLPCALALLIAVVGLDQVGGNYAQIMSSITLVSLFGGAAIVGMGAMGLGREHLEPVGCLGWLAGFFIACSLANAHTRSEVIFLLVPIGAAAGVYLSARFLRTSPQFSPLLPVLVFVLLASLLVAAKLEGDTRRWRVLKDLFEMAALAGCLQLGFALFGRPPAEGPKGTSEPKL